MLLLLDAYVPPPPRFGGGRMIAAYSISNDGELKREMSRLAEIEKQQQKEDDELAAALLAWWRKV